MIMTNKLTNFIQNNASFLILILSLIGFLISFVSSTNINFEEMGTNQFFLFEMMPLTYWFGLVIIAIPLLLGILFLRDKLPPWVVLISCLFLGISMRITFSGPFTNPIAFSNDNAFYMNIIRPWTTGGIDFAVEGRYQHDFPLSFLISFIIIKLGVSIEFFFRWAPIVIFPINFIISYFIFKEILPRNKAFLAGVAVFLFTTSTLKFFMTANYCPNSIGSIFLLLSVFFSLRFLKQGWTIKAVAFPLACIILLVLSHHLSIVYFVVLMFGLAFAAIFFQGKSNQGAEIRLFFIAIFTYTFWWAYSHIVYPSFFANYVFAMAPAPTVIRVSGLVGLDLIVFIIQPFFISILFFLGIFEYLRIRDFDNSKNILKSIPFYLKNIKQLKLEQTNNLLFFSLSSITILILLAMSFVATNLYSDRVLDILLFVFYPLSAKTLFNMTKGRSRKVKVLLVIILVILILTSTYRYFRENQRALNIY